MSHLKVKNLNTGYKKKQVLYDVSLDIETGETILLIGANGSGKSTLFKAIYGILPLWKNRNMDNCRIIFDDKEITNTPTENLISKGLVYIPQKNQLFENLTVEENLRVSTLHIQDIDERSERLHSIFSDFVLLNDKRSQVASELSGGERKILTFAISLINKPKLLLFDEPLAGLSDDKLPIVFDGLSLLKEMGTTLVIIEHRVRELFRYADRVIGLKLGQLNKPPLNNLDDIKAFLL